MQSSEILSRWQEFLHPFGRKENKNMHIETAGLAAADKQALLICFLPVMASFRRDIDLASCMTLKQARSIYSAVTNAFIINFKS
jgi:hypothetical protein